MRTKALLAIVVASLTLSAAGCASRRDPDLAPLPPMSEPISTGSALVAPYRLHAGDVLRVKFRYHPELDVRVPVREDGRINIQGVGEAEARGKTAEELSRDIEQISSDRLREPEVTVIVAELGPNRIYVGGEVRLPGPVPFREGMTPLQAIIDRGGFTDVARPELVFKGSWKGDHYEVTKINLKRTIKDGAPEDTTLAVNDVLYVPRSAIGDANSIVEHYFRQLIPIQPRWSLGTVDW